MVQEGAVLERPSRVHRTGRAIVLIPGPYDNLCKKINGINTYDVFGSHSFELRLGEENLKGGNASIVRF